MSFIPQMILLAQIPVSKPLIDLLEFSDLSIMKSDTTKSFFYGKLKQEADSYCLQKPIVVTDKQKTFAPDLHYYCSVGPYWWPDVTSTSFRYINKDGLINPEYYDYDAVRLERFVNRCKTLGKIFYVTEDEKYYDAFIRQLRAWFIDADTYMYPNLDYGQVIPGQNGNKGRSNAFIDIYPFNDLLDAIRLVNQVTPIDKTTLKALQKWFRQFCNYMDNGESGQSLRKLQNNISVAYDITLINIFLFIGKENKARQLANTFADNRIYIQINELGEQPAELRRTKAATYSLFNLAHFLDFCYLVRYWYPDYYQKHSERLDASFTYLINVGEHPDNYAYQQISGWDVYNSSLKTLLRKRDYLLKLKSTIK